jgi:hypothetical protein
LGYATHNLQVQGATYILAASSVREFQQEFTALGFKQTKTANPMIQAGVAVPQAGWLLGKGDHDWDQFPLA